VNIRSSSNSNAFLNVNVVQAEDHLITSTIRSSGQIFNVRDQTGTGPTIINANVVQTDDHLRAPTIKSTGSTVNVQNNAGDPGTLNANVVQADDHLKAPTVRSTGTVLNVRSSNLSNAILDVNAVQTPTIKSTGSTVNVQNNAGDPGTLNANVVQAGTLNANAVQTPTIRSTGSTVNVQNNAGDLGTLNANVVQADDHLRSDQIRNKTVGGTINVRDSGGAATTLNVGTLQTDTIRRASTGTGAINVRASDGAGDTTLNVNTISASIVSSNVLKNASNFRAIRATNNSNNRGFIDARNVPVSVAFIKSDGTVQHQMSVKTSNLAFSLTSRSSTGTYSLTPNGGLINPAFFVTCNSATEKVFATTSWNTNVITIKIYNTGGTLTNSDFQIAIYDFTSNNF
jgi:hypothetical protein